MVKEIIGGKVIGYIDYDIETVLVFIEKDDDVYVLYNNGKLDNIGTVYAGLAYSKKNDFVTPLMSFIAYELASLVSKDSLEIEGEVPKPILDVINEAYDFVAERKS